ncbi:MAG TPA: AMP-binding protein, partial [Burkholderiales bacterium]|nr:AMP-binding protein [Burkholderiales bacterium]
MNGALLLLGEEALARRGRHAALLCGEEHVTYEALAAHVRRAAGALQGRGIVRGERVVLLMRDCPAFAAAWLGIVHA